MEETTPSTDSHVQHQALSKELKRTHMIFGVSIIVIALILMAIAPIVITGSGFMGWGGEKQNNVMYGEKQNKGMQEMNEMKNTMMPVPAPSSASTTILVPS